MQFFEDIPVGQPEDLGTHTVTADGIVTFGEQFDPLPFHIDEAAATETTHGGLIASGYHTLCIANRIVVDGFRREIAAVAGIGLEELRWHAPVRPGDTLAVTHEIVEKRPSEGHPELGIVRYRVTVRRDGDPVLSYVGVGMVERRDPGASDGA